MAGG
ncbi:hypothetical protein YPPY13_1881, partial [Yersinia pestis PY-13]|jgi:hypothetical protein